MKKKPILFTMMSTLFISNMGITGVHAYNTKQNSTTLGNVNNSHLSENAEKRLQAENDELKMQLKMIMKRVEELEKRDTVGHKQQILAAADNKVLSVTPKQSPAEPSPAPQLAVPQDGRQGISLTELVTHAKDNKLKVNITGQLNRGLRVANNGKRGDVQQVGNGSSTDRIALIAEGDLNQDVTVGGVYMMELLQNSTLNTDIKNASSSEASFTTRKAEVYGVSKKAGELYLGHGYMASYESMNGTDFSATGVVMDGEKINEVASAVTFYNKTKHAISSGLTGTTKSLTVGKIFDNCDGLGRKDRIRYNTPRFNGFSLQSSYAFDTNAGMWDIALRYADKWGATQVGGTWDFVRNNSVQLTTTGLKTQYEQVNGSVGALFPNGISIMLAGAHRNWKYKNAPDANLGFAKLGYQDKFFNVGKTAFAVDYGQYHNFVIDTSHGIDSVRLKHRGQSVGLGMVQFIDKVNAEVYLTGRFYKLRVPNSDTYKPISVAMFGARISF